MGQRLRPTKHVLHEDLSGEVVLLELSAGVYYSLDAVGSRIWNLVIAGRTAEEISAELTREYDVSSDQAKMDVDRLLEELAKNKLLEEADA
jgi:hypothetical protein